MEERVGSTGDPQDGRVPKGVALVVRRRGADIELLVFDHPTTPPQIPKGTLEMGEDPVDGTLRELAEETGLSAVRILRTLSPLDIDDDWEDAVSPRQRWYPVVLTPTRDVPRDWSHRVRGDGADAGMTFHCRFVALGAAKEELHRLFGPLVDRLLGPAADDVL